MSKQTSLKPMRSVWRSLLWKEWHEHKWKLVGLFAILSALYLAFTPFGDGTFAYGIYGLIGALIIPYGILAGLFVGMGTAASEQQRSTMHFLQTLPISMQKPAVIKLLLSLVTVSLPIIALLTLAFLIRPSEVARMESLVQRSLVEGLTVEERSELFDLQSEYGHWHSQMSPIQMWDSVSLAGFCLSSAIGGILFVSSLLIWMAACGVNRSDEIRAGAIGFLTIIVVLGIFALLADYADRTRIVFLMQSVVTLFASAPGMLPFLPSMSRELNIPVALLLASAIGGHAFLIYWYVTRFGRQATRPARSTESQVSVAANVGGLAPPYRNPLTAIMWKQFWETGPLALFAATAAVGMAALGYWVQDNQSALSNSFGEILAAVAMSVGFMVTLVAGIGVFLEDMKPQVGVFWRSRPIRYPAWFGVKYLTGLLVLGGVFGVVLLFAFLLQRDRFQTALNMQELRWGITWTLLFFVLIYTLSLTTYCVIRHPILAAMSTIVLLSVGVIVIPLFSDKLLDHGPHPYLTVITMAIAQICALAIGYRAVRDNWALQR